MKAFLFTLLVLSSSFAQAKTEQQVQYCKTNASLDAGMYLEINVYNVVVCSEVKIEATDLLAYEELEKMLQDSRFSLGRAAELHCRGQKNPAECKDKLIHDTKTAVEAVVENKKRNQGYEKLTSDKLAYRAVEEAVLTPGLGIAKAIDTYCRQ